MNFESPQYFEETSRKKNEQGKEKEKEYDLFDLDEYYENKCIKQYLLDLAYNTNKEKIEKKGHLKLDEQKIKETLPKDIEKLIEDTSLEKLYSIPGIVEAYEDILEEFNRGKKPTITAEEKFLYRMAENGIKAEDLDNTYDGRKVLVGQIGKKPFKSGERAVLEIDCEPKEIIPRNTKQEEKIDKFQFHGTVIFEDEQIPPEKATLISVPEGVELPEGAEPPIKLSELKKYYH